MTSYENYRNTTGPFAEDSGEKPSVLGNIVSTLTMDKIEGIMSYHGITNDNSVEYTHIPSHHGENQFHLKDTCNQATTHNRRVENEDVNVSDTNNESSKMLLDEIDNNNTSEMNKTQSKSNTLTRMLRSIRKEKVSDGNTDDVVTETQSTRSLGKMLQKVNPVNKQNRENISKVFHRIGDALHSNNVTIEDSDKKSKMLSKTKKQQTDSEDSQNKTSNIGQRLYHQLGSTFKLNTGENKESKQEGSGSEHNAAR